MPKILLKYQWLLLVFLYLSYFPAAQGQLLTASTKKYSQNAGSTKNAKNLKSLATILTGIKEQYQVNFHYDSELVAAQKADATVVETHKNNLDLALQQLLKPLKLAFIKAGNNSYIIVAEPAVTKDKNQPALSKAADATITGKVTSEAGEPLIGVTVVLKGSTIGTTTDVAGNYSLSVPDNGGTLVFSYIGYIAKEVAVNKATTLNVILLADAKALQEVVIVGFGEQKKESVTAAISSVSSKELVQSPQANISNMLVGRLPGLIAQQTSGEPGNNQSMLRIRGIGTFTGGQDPLVMVDGIERPNFNNIDANEIETINILKDASATAVYGVRGANGVVLITTKRGKKGAAPRLSYSGNVAMQKPTKLPNYLGSYDFATMYNEAVKNDAYVLGTDYEPVYDEEDLALYRSGADPVFHPNVDWMDMFLKPYSMQTQHNLNISGGTEQTRYFVSLGYFDQEGLYKYSDANPEYETNPKYKRYNFRSNFDFDITSQLTAVINLAGQVEDINYPGQSAGDIFRALSWANPLNTPGMIDGKVVRLQGNGLESRVNPLLNLLGNGYQTDFRSNINTSVRFNYNLDVITKGLAVHATGAYDSFYNQFVQRGKPLVTYLATPDPDNPGKALLIPQGEDRPLGFGEGVGKNRKIYTEAGIDYNRTFGDHTVTGLILYNQSKYHDPGLQFLVPRGYQGIVGRVTYNFKDRYLAEFNMGYNGSENFAEKKRFGFFPAYSLGWNVSEESFFPKNNLVTFMKIRGSYGVVGNDQLPGARFLYRPSAYGYSSDWYNRDNMGNGGFHFGTVGENFNYYRGSYEDKLGNPDLTWEKAKKSNIGLELKFLRDRLSFTGDYFNEDRNDILANRGSVPTIVGANLPAYNLGVMNNQGYELELGFNNTNNDFVYWIKGNYSYAHNEVKFKDEPSQTYPYLNTTGNRFNQFFGLVADGFYNTWEEVNEPTSPKSAYTSKLQPGDIKYIDINGDGIINNDDRVPIGYSNFPEKVFGLSFGSSWKGFDVSALFQGATNVSFNYFGRALWPFADGTNSAKDIILQRWTPERYAAGEPINFPRLQRTPNYTDHNYVQSTFWVRDADYVRLKNVEVGYTFRGGLLNRLKMSSARLYANGFNLFTWTDVLYFDPEAPSASGVSELYYYPQQKTFNLGFNVQF